MGTPARHERYPEVIHICRVIPNLCSQAEDPLGIYRSAALRAALGELCGSRGGSFLVLKVKSLRLSLTWWAWSTVRTFRGTVCLLTGVSVSFGCRQRRVSSFYLWTDAKDWHLVGPWVDSRDRRKVLGLLSYNWPCTTTKKIPLWKPGHRGGIVPPKLLNSQHEAKVRLEPRSHFPETRLPQWVWCLVPVIPAFE